MRARIVPGGVGLVCAVAVWAAVSQVFPLAYARTLLPVAAGLMCGALVSLWIASRTDDSLRFLTRWTAVAFALATVLVNIVLLVQPEALDPRNFSWWIPIVAGISAIVWLAAFLVERRLDRTHPAFTAAFAGLALAAALIHNAAPLYGALRGEHLRTWNVYHYYLGSKYFTELGYQDLYAATLAADDEWQRRKALLPRSERARLDELADFSHIDRTRDMQTYRIVSRQTLTSVFDRGAFGDTRWQELGRDTRRLRSRFGAEQWRNVLTDWGYNPAPPWTVVGTPLANLISLDSSLFWLIANSDLPLFFLMFAALWWAYGLRAALIATVWVNVIHFNRGRFAGGFFQYDWLASSVIALALYHRQRAAAAGVALSWAVMTRVFPVFLVLPLMAKIMGDLLRREGPFGERLRPRHRRFLTALCASCLLLFIASHFTGRGLHTWPQWADNILLHSEALALDPMHLGAGRLAQHQPSQHDFWSSRQGSSQERLAAAIPVRLAYQIVGGVLLLGALIRRREQDAMILMLFAVFLAFTLTRYYGTIWVLLFLLGAGDRLGRISWPSATAGFFLLAMASWFYAPGPQQARYFLANYQAFVMFCALCAGYIVLDLTRMVMASKKAKA